MPNVEVQSQIAMQETSRTSVITNFTNTNLKKNLITIVPLSERVYFYYKKILVICLGFNRSHVVFKILDLTLHSFIISNQK